MDFLRVARILIAGEVKEVQSPRIISNKLLLSTKVLLTAAFACIIALPSSQAGTVQEKAQPAPAAHPKTRTLPQRYRSTQQAASARRYYSMIWGVDSLSVKSTEEGEVIRFAYRIVDVDKAVTLNDKKNEPSLIDPEAGVKLIIPALEKIGKLRQSSTPQPGKVYWMAFSNKGGYVKPGHRVNIAIGAFRADGLIVQ